MTRRTPITESDLATVVIAWLEALGADVYQEVELSRQGIRADIVAKRGPELTIIETKTSMSLALVEQAMERRRFAHRVYVAAPCGRARAAGELCREVGIGVLDVRVGTDSQWDAPRVRELVPSRRWNTRPVELAAKLRPEHKTHAKAGATTGGHWSPFRATCEQVAVEVARNPGIALKQVIANIRHHYATNAGARSSLATWIRAGKVARVRIDDGRLWPATSAALGGNAT